jgi:hypothetical protein
MRKSGLLAAALCAGALFISCDSSEELRDFVNDHIISAVNRGIEVTGQAGNPGGGVPKPFWENGRLVSAPGSTVRLRVLLENSRNTVYGVEFLGRDAELVMRDGTSFEGVSVVCFTVKMPEEEPGNKNLDITLRLIAPGVRKPPDEIPLPLDCASVNIEFRYIAAYGSADGAAKLLLCFDRSIPGFSKEDITITGAAATGELRETGTVSGIYELETGNISGAITVNVDKKGYRIEPSSQTTTLSSLDPVVFGNMEAAGGAQGGETATALTLTFSKAIPGLTAEYLTLDPGGTGAVKGSLASGGDGVYTLSLDGVSAGGFVAVTASKAGYLFVPPSRTAEVFYVKQVAFTGLEAGGEAGTATTAWLTLTFDEDIDGLVTSDITLVDTGGTGATKATLSGNGSTYTLGISGITAAGEITVTVGKSGCLISPASKTVQVHKNMGVPVVGAADMPSIKAKFGVTATGVAGVEAAFNELHAYIQKSEFTSTGNVIKLGDWIDLEGGLAVAAYDGPDAMGGGDFVYTGTSVYTHLIVVGINSFHSEKGSNEQYTITENDNTPHVVFQFQNMPVMRRMNQSDTNQGGYAGSEMRAYLIGNFLTGLIAAGVPDNVLWAPVRYISNGTSGAGSGILTDKLWLPTDREMFQGRTRSADGETVGNQARLEYYTDNSRRQKSSSGEFLYYWMSSAYPDNSSAFCDVVSAGNADNHSASNAEGVAPAFCVN